MNAMVVEDNGSLFLEKPFSTGEGLIAYDRAPIPMLCEADRRFGVPRHGDRLRMRGNDWVFCSDPVRFYYLDATQDLEWMEHRVETVRKPRGHYRWKRDWLEWVKRPSKDHYWCTIYEEWRTNAQDLEQDLARSR